MENKVPSIVLALDAAAQRCDLIGARPASQKQIFFLANLIDETGGDASAVGCCVSNTQATLTCKQASGFIQDYLDARARFAVGA